MRDDQHPKVGTLVGEALQGEADEIATVAGDRTETLMGSPFKLVMIRLPIGANLVHSDDIMPQARSNGATPLRPKGSKP